MADGPQKRLIWLRGFLQGRRYYRALDALKFAGRFHTGLRKDGVTPILDHMVSIVEHVVTLAVPECDMEDLVVVVLLHDVREDHNVSDDEIRRRFGARVADAVECLTKEFRGVKKPIAIYFEEISLNRLAAIAKGGDRFHNQNTMTNVFKLHKEREYVLETQEWFFPMLKEARRNFPDIELVFQNLKTSLASQVHLIEARLDMAA